MKDKRPTPYGNGAKGNSLLKQSTVIRFLFLLSIVGTFVAILLSVSIGNNVSSSLSQEAASFSAPRRKRRMKKRNKLNKQREPGATLSLGTGRRPGGTLSLAYNFTHFLSHIPKTGVEYAAQDLARLVFGTIPLPGNKTILSIQDAQHQYNRSLQIQQHQDQDNNHFDKNFFDKNSRNHDHENPNSDAYAPPIVCNHGAQGIPYWSPYHFARSKSIKFRCSMVISERPWQEDIPNVYTIVREPLSHIVSQYFHCADSHDHAGSDRMPSMEEWLNAYTKLSDSLSLETRPPYIEKWRKHKEAFLLREKFNCYNPIDSESFFVQFPAKNEDGSRMVLPKDYVYPYPFDDTLPRDEETQRIDKQLFDDLKKRFRVIGDTARMIKSICSIFIDMTNGEHIPTPCDCTHWDETKKQQHSLDPTFKVLNLYQKDPTIKAKSALWILRPYLELGYNPDKHAHGVKVRGSAFVKDGLTDSQKAQITDHLRTLDLVLYNVSRAVFDAQTSELEKAHGIKICDDSFNREGEIFIE